MKPRLSESMTEAQFENGYWYATELKAFARRLGLAYASGLRKDELEAAIRQRLRTGALPAAPRRRSPAKRGPRDSERGLRPSLPVVNYTNDRETKDFLLREARRIAPEVKIQSGTRYPLNRWREKQLRRGRTITYGDLARRFVELNRTKTGPLRTSHGRYNNFVSDFSKAHSDATREQMLRAWEELKELDAPKTYASWAKHQKTRPPR